MRIQERIPRILPAALYAGRSTDSILSRLSRRVLFGHLMCGREFRFGGCRLYSASQGLFLRYVLIGRHAVSYFSGSHRLQTEGGRIQRGEGVRVRCAAREKTPGPMQPRRCACNAINFSFNPNFQPLEFLLSFLQVPKSSKGPGPNRLRKNG
jgi:hypothetical protein